MNLSFNASDEQKKNNFGIFMCKYFVDILSNGSGARLKLRGAARVLFYKAAALFNKSGRPSNRQCTIDGCGDKCDVHIKGVGGDELTAVRGANTHALGLIDSVPGADRRRIYSLDTFSNSWEGFKVDFYKLLDGFIKAFF